MKNEYDSPWKEVLEYFFQPFITFFLPELADAIDWSRGYEFLDKELNKILRDQKIGKCVVDKLVKVWRKDGKEQWLLIHIDVQMQRQTKFPERMYIYNYRLFDKFHQSVISIAVLADGVKNWRPYKYERNIWGTKLHFNFISIKLLDYMDQEEKLMTDSNPFGIVIWAHLQSLKTKKDFESRLKSKIIITRALFRQGYNKNFIAHLYRFIDWVLALPESFELEYNTEIKEDKKMTYITSIERLGIKKGIEKGMGKGERMFLSKLLKLRFGSLSANQEKKLSKASEDDLMRWGEKLLNAQVLEEVFEEA